MFLGKIDGAGEEGNNVMWPLKDNKRRLGAGGPGMTQQARFSHQKK